jgi:hypothetical protein
VSCELALLVKPPDENVKEEDRKRRTEYGAKETLVGSLLLSVIEQLIFFWGYQF